MTTANNTNDFVAKQGEQLVLSATLYGADGAVADLTGATVTFALRPTAPSGAPITLVGSTAIVGAATLGTVKYSGTVADTSTTTGSVIGEFTADYGAGRVKKFPDGMNDYLLGYITPKIS